MSSNWELERVRVQEMLDWHRAFTPGQLRAVALLHEAVPEANYRKAFRVIQRAEAYRLAGNIGMAILVILRAGYGPLDARTAVYALSAPVRALADWQLDQDWSSLSRSQKAKEWKRWWAENARGRFRGLS